MRKIKNITLLLVGALGLSGQAGLACSNLAVTLADHSNTIVARTMDYPNNPHTIAAFGAVGAQNQGSVMLEQPIPDSRLINWTNRHKFVGQVVDSNHDVMGGVNDQGLYVGMLYQAGISHYPKFNPQDKRPVLSAYELGNYLLGTAGSVEQAVKEIKALQIVGGVSEGFTPKEYIKIPLHVVIRDVAGDSAVVEFANGKVDVVHPAGNVMTNEPGFRWQTKNLKDNYADLSNKNSSKTWKGLHLEGSGFRGLPGDWTSVSRFVRASKVLEYSPVPHTEQQAESIALAAIRSVIVPLGMNPSPTLWVSGADLKHHVYYFKRFYDVVNAEKHIYKLAGSTKSHVYQPWASYPLSAITPENASTFGVVKVQLTRRHLPSDAKIKNLVALSVQPGDTAKTYFSTSS